MKHRLVMSIVAINLIALIALVFLFPQFMVGPGPVMPAHSGIATDCFACHAPFRGTAPERCQACHLVAEIGVFTTKGKMIAVPDRKVAFHQHLSEQNCLACHSDHTGPKLTGHGQKPFSHSLLAADVRMQCDSCHAKPKDEFHTGIEGNCQQCHSSSAWKPATFDHDKFFLLDGDHKAHCATCHVDNDLTRYTCYGCHAHTPQNIIAEHAEEGIRDVENCVECHRSADDEGHGNRGRNDDD